MRSCSATRHMGVIEENNRARERALIFELIISHTNTFFFNHLATVNICLVRLRLTFIRLHLRYVLRHPPYGTHCLADRPHEKLAFHISRGPYYRLFHPHLRGFYFPSSPI